MIILTIIIAIAAPLATMLLGAIVQAESQRRERRSNIWKSLSK